MPPCQTEVEHLDLPLRRQLDVGRLQIAMDDPLAVRCLEGFGDLAADPESLFERKRTAREPLRQGLPLDELQHEEARPARLLDPVDRRDVRVAQGRQGARLPLEPGQVLRIPRQRAGQDLDGHLPVETAVARAPDLSHPSRAEWREDLVRAQARPRADHGSPIMRVSTGTARRGAEEPRTAGPSAGGRSSSRV